MPMRVCSRTFFSRLKERSSWLGLIALATACGATIETVLAEQIIAAGMAIGGLIGVFPKESPGSTEATATGKESGHDYQ